MKFWRVFENCLASVPLKSRQTGETSFIYEAAACWLIMVTVVISDCIVFYKGCL